ncbi:inner membrane protein import complex subunit Tim54-domain-containing protein [Hyaloraphidium curvatum]|nr:inner membrane protein import complex subunit Tim54-domain-containing protein [Hyaloraphidium curvatum]
MASQPPAEPSAAASPPPSAPKFDPPPAPEAKPAPTTLAGRLRARLPSRNWSIFLAVTGAISAAIYYDTNQTEKIRKEFAERLRPVRERPVEPLERVGKVLVYLGVPVNQDDATKVRNLFKDHVKPVFDAAALDYILLESRPPPSLRNEVRRRIHQAKRPPPPPKDPLLDPIPDEPPLDLGIVAVGRGAWRELLLGLQDGMESFPLTKDEEDIERAHGNWKEKKDRAKRRGDPFDLPEPVRPSGVARSPANAALSPEIPPLGMIPYRNIVGMRFLPWRIAGWFNDRAVAREAGEAAFAVCTGRSRPMRRNEEALGFAQEEEGRTKSREKLGREWEVFGREVGLDEEVLARLKVFDPDGEEVQREVLVDWSPASGYSVDR